MIMRMGRKVMEGIKECPKGKNGKKRTGKEDWYCVSTGMERIQIEHKKVGTGTENKRRTSQVPIQEWECGQGMDQGRSTETREGTEMRTRQAQTHGWEWG